MPYVRAAPIPLLSAANTMQRPRRTCGSNARLPSSL